MRIVNMDLLVNPANWIIVWTMVAFSLIAMSIINTVPPLEAKLP